MDRSDIGTVVRQIIDGNLQVLRGLIDFLYDNASCGVNNTQYFELRDAVANAAIGALSIGAPADETALPHHMGSIGTDILYRNSWRRFTEELVRIFWFELYTFDRTASLLEYNRARHEEHAAEVEALEVTVNQAANTVETDVPTFSTAGVFAATIQPALGDPVVRAQLRDALDAVDAAQGTGPFAPMAAPQVGEP